MTRGIQHITPFLPEESTGDTDSIWALFSHTGISVTAIGLLIPAGLGIFCCYFFWCQPARLVCQPLQPGTMHKGANMCVMHLCWRCNTFGCNMI